LLLTGEQATAVWKRSYPSVQARIYALPHPEQDAYYANRKLGIWGRFSECSDHADKLTGSNAQAIATLIGMLAWHTEKIKRVETKGQKLILEGIESGEARIFGFEHPRRFSDNAVEVVRECMGAECSLDWEKGMLISNSLKIVEVRFLTSVDVQNIAEQFRSLSGHINTRGEIEDEPKRLESFRPKTGRGPGRPTVGMHTQLAVRQLIEEGSFNLQGVVRKQVFKIRERMLLNDPSLDVTDEKPSNQTIERVVKSTKDQIASKLNIFG
jgi:hypothetical protein